MLVIAVILHLQIVIRILLQQFQQVIAVIFSMLLFLDHCLSSPFTFEVVDLIESVDKTKLLVDQVFQLIQVLDLICVL